MIPTEHAVDDTGFAMLPVDHIEANQQQPRVRFDQETLDQLAASIREVGILQPIAVMRIEDSDRYRIINGERRWRAARQAGLTEVPAVIRTVDDERLLTEALIENLQRRDLTPFEESAAIAPACVDAVAPLGEEPWWRRDDGTREAPPTPTRIALMSSARSANLR